MQFLSPVLLACCLALAADAAFVPSPARAASSAVQAPSRSCAPVAFAATKKKASKKKAASTGGGFGAAKGGPSSPKAPELLKRSMAMYETLERRRLQRAELEAASLDADEEESDDTAEEEESSSITRWTVTLRTDSTGSAEFADWVPVTILALECDHDADPTKLMPSAVGASCREIHEAGCQALPSLRKVARDRIQYAYEPLDQFESHVCDGLQGRAERRREAAETLGIDSSAESGDVKRAHRRLMMELHPDRHVDDVEAAEAAAARLIEVQAAYAELGGGQGVGSGSWYESVGGKARVSFSGALGKEELGAMGKARPEMEHPVKLGGWRVGNYPMGSELTKEFAARNGQRYAARA